MAFGKKRKSGTFTDVASLNDDPMAALRAMTADNQAHDDEENRIKNDITKMIDQGIGSVTDLWAPPRMRIQNDYIEMGDECVSTFTVSNWPSSLHYGWLTQIIDDSSLTDVKMDISMHIHPIRKEYAILYMQDKYASAMSSYESDMERGKLKRDNEKVYSAQMNTASQIRSMLDNDNENLFQVALVFGIYGESQWETDEETGEEICVKDAREDVIEKTKRVKKILSKNSGGGFEIKPLLHQQREGIKSLLPWGYGGLHSFQNFYTSALATCYPFTHGKLQVEGGVFYGISLASGQPIFFDNFSKQWLNNFSTIVLGSSGSGKRMPDDTKVYRCDTNADGRISSLSSGKLGNLSVGDVILGGNGRPCTVTDVYPQGECSDNYVMRLSDGREEVSGGPHMWSVVVRNKHGYDKRVVMTTEQIHDVLGNDDSPYGRLRLENVDPVDICEKTLPISANVFGLFVGRHLECPDSSIREIVEDMHDTGLLHSFIPVDDMVEKLSCMFPDGNVTIPVAYVESSNAQRCELLAGLLGVRLSNERDVELPEYMTFEVSDDELTAKRICDIIRMSGMSCALHKFDGKFVIDAFDTSITTLDGSYGRRDGSEPLSSGFDSWLLGYITSLSHVGRCRLVRGASQPYLMVDAMALDVMTINDHIPDGYCLILPDVHQICDQKLAVTLAIDDSVDDRDGALKDGLSKLMYSAMLSVGGMQIGNTFTPAQSREFLDGCEFALAHDDDGVTAIDLPYSSVAFAFDIAAISGDCGIESEINSHGSEIRVRLSDPSHIDGCVDIKTVDEMDESIPMTCIKVDNYDSTFVVDDFVRTHNSATVKTLLGRYAIRGTQIFVIDPAATTQGEYTNLATSLDGQVIDFGGRNSLSLNPFELKVPSNWNVHMPTDPEKAVEIYMTKKTYLKGMFDIMRGIYDKENNVSDMNLDVFGKITDMLIDRVYQFKGINITASGWDYRQWNPKYLPTMNTFYELLREYEQMIQDYTNKDAMRGWSRQHLTQNGELINKSSRRDRIMLGYYRYVINEKNPIWGKPEYDVVHYLKNIVEEYIFDEKKSMYSEKSALFSGKNTADLSNQCIVFRFSSVSETMKELATYLTFELIYGRIQQQADDDNSAYDQKILVMDEAWKMIRTPSCRQYVEKFIREGRKLKAGLWLITQSFMDVQGDNSVFFDQAETKIVLALSDKEVQLISDSLDLSPSMSDLINNEKNETQPGMGIISVGGRQRATVSFYCQMTELEMAIADTTDTTKPPLTPADILGEEQARECGLA